MRMYGTSDLQIIIVLIIAVNCCSKPPRHTMNHSTFEAPTRTKWVLCTLFEQLKRHLSRSQVLLAGCSLWVTFISCPCTLWPNVYKVIGVLNHWLHVDRHFTFCKTISHHFYATPWHTNIFMESCWWPACQMAETNYM